jgi:hypothetical protein
MGKKTEIIAVRLDEEQLCWLARAVMDLETNRAELIFRSLVHSIPVFLARPSIYAAVTFEDEQHSATVKKLTEQLNGCQ